MLHISSVSPFSCFVEGAQNVTYQLLITFFMLCRGGTKCYISAPYHLFMLCRGGTKCYISAPYHLFIFMLCRGGTKCYISAPYHFLFFCFVEGAQNVTYQLLITFYFYAL